MAFFNSEVDVVVRDEGAYRCGDPFGFLFPACAPCPPTRTGAPRPGGGWGGGRAAARPAPTDDAYFGAFCDSTFTSPFLICSVREVSSSFSSWGTWESKSWNGARETPPFSSEPT